MSGRIVLDDTQPCSDAKLSLTRVMANGPTGFVEVSIEDGFGGLAEADLEAAATSVVSR